MNDTQSEAEGGERAGGMRAAREETEDMIYYAHKNSAFVTPPPPHPILICEAD